MNQTRKKGTSYWTPYGSAASLFESGTMGGALEDVAKMLDGIALY